MRRVLAGSPGGHRDRRFRVRAEPVRHRRARLHRACPGRRSRPSRPAPGSRRPSRSSAIPPPPWTSWSSTCPRCPVGQSPHPPHKHPDEEIDRHQGGDGGGARERRDEAGRPRVRDLPGREPDAHRPQRGRRARRLSRHALELAGHAEGPRELGPLRPWRRGALRFAQPARRAGCGARTPAAGAPPGRPS